MKVIGTQGPGDYSDLIVIMERGEFQKITGEALPKMTINMKYDVSDSWLKLRKVKESSDVLRKLAADLRITAELLEAKCPALEEFK